MQQGRMWGIKLSKNNLDILQQKEEEFWRIRSRWNWLAYGDKNIRCFNHHTSQRKKKNHIEGLLDEQGNEEDDSDKMEDIAVNYFSTLFIATTPNHAFESVLEGVEF